jgi:hypothetical protein
MAGVKDNPIVSRAGMNPAPTRSVPCRSPKVGGSRFDPGRGVARRPAVGSSSAWSDAGPGRGPRRGRVPARRRGAGRVAARACDAVRAARERHSGSAPCGRGRKRVVVARVGRRRRAPGGILEGWTAAGSDHPRGRVPSEHRLPRDSSGGAPQGPRPGDVPYRSGALDGRVLVCQAPRPSGERFNVPREDLLRPTLRRVRGPASSQPGSSRPGMGRSRTPGGRMTSARSAPGGRGARAHPRSGRSKSRLSKIGSTHMARPCAWPGRHRVSSCEGAGRAVGEDARRGPGFQLVSW